jgi:hypothetical protein
MVGVDDWIILGRWIEGIDGRQLGSQDPDGSFGILQARWRWTCKHIQRSVEGILSVPWSVQLAKKAEMGRASPACQWRRGKVFRIEPTGFPTDLSAVPRVPVGLSMSYQGNVINGFAKTELNRRWFFVICHGVEGVGWLDLYTGIRCHSICD